MHGCDRLTAGRIDTAPDHYKPGRFRAMNVRLVDADEKPTERANPGMYAEQPDTSDSALAEGLRKLMSRGREGTKL
jgi:hypothetical protein